MLTETITDKRKTRAKDVSRIITEEHDFATVLETGEILVREGGVYRAGKAEAIIKEKVEELEPNETNNFAREVIGHVERSTFCPADEFDQRLMEINLANGIYDLENKILVPHGVYYYSRVQLPVEYDPRAKCPKIMKFLQEVLPNEADRENVLEDAASALIRDARFQKAFMYIGKGSNGKTTWLLTLNAILGKENVANESIHDLGMSRFGAGNIEGKLAVIYPDIAASEIVLTGKLKAIISGDRISVERKGIQGHPITPFCKLFYAANSLPVVQDDSDAWFRRWRITNWDVQIDGGKRNANLLAELTDPSELSGLFNLLVGYANRLLENKRFTYEATIHQTRVEWGDRSNVLRAFLTKKCNVGLDMSVESSLLYAAYVRFCNEGNFTAKQQKGFMEELKSLTPVRSVTRRVGSKTPKFVDGLVLKDVPTLENVSGVSDVSGSPPGKTGEESRVRGVSEPETPATPETSGITDDALKAFRSYAWRSQRVKTPITEPATPETTSAPKSPEEQEPELWWACSQGDAGPWGPDEKGKKVAVDHCKMLGPDHKVVQQPKPGRSIELDPFFDAVKGRKGGDDRR